MGSKGYKAGVFFLLTFVLLSATFIESARASTMGPTLSAVSPSIAPPGVKAIIDGMSYRDGSDIVFYKGATEKARIGLTPPPALPLNSFVSPSLPSVMSTEFIFTVPTLLPDIYTVRLEHTAILGPSEPLPFIILPVVNSFSPKEANHLSLFEINGTGFSKERQKNLVRFTSGFEINPSVVSDDKFQFYIYNNPPLKIGSYQAQVWAKMEDRLIESAYAPAVNRSFTIYPHLYTLMPSYGLPDSQLNIQGPYFHSDVSKVKVNFYQSDKKLAEIQPAGILVEGSSLLVKVPAKLGEGTYAIKVSVQDVSNPARWIESDNSINFVITAPPPPTAPEQPASSPQDNQEPTPDSEE